MKTNHKKEEIFALINEKSTGKETRVPKKIKKHQRHSTRIYEKKQDTPNTIVQDN